MNSNETLDISYHQLISTDQLAKIISYQPQTIRKWLSEDKLPEGFPRPTKIGNRNRWLLIDINEYLERCTKSRNSLTSMQKQ